MKTYLKDNRGFTLVELAIVMIIIGLLIGGILKGQELINNAEVSSTVSLIKSVDTAMGTFRDAYGAFPGDMDTPTVRIPDCTAAAAPACAQAGNANGRIGDGPGNAHATIANENGAAWAQMAAADVMGGVNSTNPTATATGSLESLPEASLGGALQIGFHPGGALTSSALSSQSGHYVLLDASGAAASSNATGSLSQSDAARLDRRMDDGLPNTGSVRAMGNNGANECFSTATAVGVYNEAQSSLLCGIYSRVQG